MIHDCAIISLIYQQNSCATGSTCSHMMELATWDYLSTCCHGADPSSESCGLVINPVLSLLHRADPVSPAHLTWSRIISDVPWIFCSFLFCENWVSLCVKSLSLKTDHTCSLRDVSCLVFDLCSRARSWKILYFLFGSTKWSPAGSLQNKNNNKTTIKVNKKAHYKPNTKIRKLVMMTNLKERREEGERQISMMKWGRREGR